jgi:hypothetical protein
MKTRIIGIDCAVDEKNIGVAIGDYEDGACKLIDIPDRNSHGKISDLVCHSIKNAGKNTDRFLLALDAPLGWPVDLGHELHNHMAGGTISSSADSLFRRKTDLFVKLKINKQPLDVGADRIARTAKAALDLINDIRKMTGLTIPLVWNSSFKEFAGIIEVYPAGTLVSHGFHNSNYKKKDQIKNREEIFKELATRMSFNTIDMSEALHDANVLDAIVCVLSGYDFLNNEAYAPDDKSSAEKEGWIWVKKRETGRGNNYD